MDYIYEKPFSLSILNNLLPLLKEDGKLKVKSMELSVDDLWEGLIVEDSIYTKDSVLLVPEGTILDTNTIQRLRKFISTRKEVINIRVKELISE